MYEYSRQALLLRPKTTARDARYPRMPPKKRGATQERYRDVSVRYPRTYTTAQMLLKEYASQVFEGGSGAKGRAGSALGSRLL